MKKRFGLGGLALAAMMLCSCGGVSQKSADKINTAYATSDTSDDYTVEKCKKEFGDPTYDLTVTLLGSTNGSMIWVNGCSTDSEVQAKNEAGKTLEALTVIIVNNTATKASYGEYTASSSSK